MLIAPNLVRVSVLPALPLLLSGVKERSVRADDLIGSRGVRKPNASVGNGQRFVGILSPLKLCQCTQPGRESDADLIRSVFLEKVNSSYRDLALRGPGTAESAFRLRH
jgi:hypothetical protein